MSFLSCGICACDQSNQEESSIRFWQTTGPVKDGMSFESNILSPSSIPAKQGAWGKARSGEPGGRVSLPQRPPAHRSPGNQRDGQAPNRSPDAAFTINNRVHLQASPQKHALRSALRTGPPDRGDEGSAWGRTSLPGEVRAARGSGGLSTDSGFDPFSCTSEGGNATERGERLDNPYTGAKTKDNGLGGQAGATDRNVSSPTRDFSFVDALENVLGIDINGDGYKGQGYGLVDGLEAVTGLDIDGDGESGAGLGKILEEVTGLDLNGDDKVNNRLSAAELEQERRRQQIQQMLEEVHRLRAKQLRIVKVYSLVEATKQNGLPLVPPEQQDEWRQDEKKIERLRKELAVLDTDQRRGKKTGHQ